MFWDSFFYMQAGLGSCLVSTQLSRDKDEVLHLWRACYGNAGYF